MLRSSLIAGYFAAAVAQKAGSRNVERSPTVQLRECQGPGSCRLTEKAAVLDANWRWVHETDGYKNCYQDSDWVEGICDDPEVCAQRCALEQVTAQEYEGTYGVKAIPGGLELRFVSETQYGKNFGSRLFLLDSKNQYEMFKLKNREFSFDVDVSELACGLNGAVYLVEMDKFGGKGKGANEAGAAYGTGYCDAQCPHDLKFIDGNANLLDWKPQHTPPVGRYGICCMEMDLWEANRMATAYTPHPCNTEGPLKCDGVACGDNDKGQRYQGVCDKDGCDFNSYRMGAKGFYGPGSEFDIDTTKPVTIVTQFITSNGKDSGDLSDIRRFYVQDGKVVPNSNATILGEMAADSIHSNFCDSQKSKFGDINDFKAKGGLKTMGEALDRGMVFVMSLWDDTDVNMLWLDSNYPADRPETTPGVARGPCPGGRESTPGYLRETYPNAAVKYMNLAVGRIGSTTTGAARRLSEVHV